MTILRLQYATNSVKTDLSFRVSIELSDMFELYDTI